MKPSDGPVSQHQRIKINAPSANLTQDENESVFKLLGRKCQTLNTAVVQIYKTEGSAHSHWKKKHTGVLCFVKDSAIRSYFLRAYCLKIHELVWEHELYDSMDIIKPKPFLLTFEGQDGHVGLNFISEEECDSFYRAVRNTIENRNRRKTEKRSRPKSQMGQTPVVLINQSDSNIGAPKHITKEYDANVQMRSHSKLNTVTITPQTTVAVKNNFSKSSSSQKTEKKKVTKADIGMPTNFTHIAHVGWNADKGFDLVGNENDDMLNKFFAKAGISEHQLKDRDTRAFIYEFIESNNVLASVKSESVSKPKATAPAPPPPPVPSRQTQSSNYSSSYISQRSAPPPPPARQIPPPIPTTVPGSARVPAPPTRPPPINNILPHPSTSNAAPPPPPPPPPQPTGAPPPPPPPMPLDIPSIKTTYAPTETKAPSSLPVVNDTRNALMESIRKGTTLKKVDSSAHSTGSGDSRSELMSEIRMGIELRPAQNRELSNRYSDEGAAGTDALADALRRALQERGRVIQSSDDESGESANDDEWDD